METITLILSEFYKLNDICINGSKLELIVINANKKMAESFSITLGSDNTLLVKANESGIASHYLGVFIRSSKSSKHIIDLLKQEIRNMVFTFKYK